ncbi:hypothetical protein BC827DRAFT_802875 [Russula dissimulans]|nr:hypothetical protein BC827DRAFT_802875 [Russula dissimulans]
MCGWLYEASAVLHIQSAAVLFSVASLDASCAIKLLLRCRCRYGRRLTLVSLCHSVRSFYAPSGNADQGTVRIDYKLCRNGEGCSGVSGTCGESPDGLGPVSKRR